MRRYTSIFFYVLFFSSIGYTQQSISGYIYDSESKEKLIGANIALSNDHVYYSNDQGYFHFEVDDNIDHFEVSYIGYNNKMIRLQPLTQDSFISVYLDRKDLLDEVVISAEKVVDRKVNTVDIALKLFEQTPVLLGEADVFKSLQLLPGVGSGSEGQGGLHVRGGSPDQNLILLDGVPVYNPAHLFGFFSTFNSDALNNVKIHTGAFPAKYSGRLSSIIDITMKEGNKDHFTGTASIGLLSTKLLAEGPIVKNKTSFLLSLRRTYLDVLFNKLLPLGSNEQGYYFLDGNFKINHEFNNKSRLSINSYLGHDQLYLNNNSGEGKSKSNLGWKNKFISLRYNHRLAKNIFTDLILYNSRYNLFNKNFEEYQSNKLQFDYDYAINDYGLKLNFDWWINSKNTMNFGVNAIDHNINPGSFSSKENSINRMVDTSYVQKPISASYISTYIDYKAKISSSISSTIGFNWANFMTNKERLNAIEPRIRLNYHINNSSQVNIGYARMTQFLQQLVNNGVGLPTDLWVSANQNISPQYSELGSIGYSMNRNNSEFSANVFYKDLQNLLTYKEGQGIYGAESWEDKVTQGEGYSFGLELFYTKTIRKYTGWISYTLSKTRHRFSDINEGRYYPYKYDKTHDISMFNKYELSKKWILSATWNYQTGIAVTLPESFTRLGFIYGDKNNFRFRPYHRLDLGASNTKHRKSYNRIWSFGLYNAYFNTNPIILRFKVDQYVQSGGFPIIPYINYKIVFK